MLDCSPYLLALQGGVFAGLKRQLVGAVDRAEHLFDATLPQSLYTHCQPLAETAAGAAVPLSPAPVTCCQR